MLDDSERTPCEIWSRCMGYHRPISFWNVGKQAEHVERKMFTEGKANVETITERKNAWEANSNSGVADNSRHFHGGNAQRQRNFIAAIA